MGFGPSASFLVAVQPLSSERLFQGRGKIRENRMSRSQPTPLGRKKYREFEVWPRREGSREERCCRSALKEARSCDPESIRGGWLPLTVAKAWQMFVP